MKMHNKLLVNLLLVISISFSECKVFRNPVISDENTPDPGALKVGERYYVVTTTNNNNPEKFPIHTSQDLQNWQFIGYVFNATNLPRWSTKDHEYWAPELHQVGDKIHVYFTTRDTNLNVLSIGVAVSNAPEGPYTPMDRALWADPKVDSWDATLVKDNNSLYLVWASHPNIVGRKLNSDGLSFDTESNVIDLISITLDWEAYLVEAPYYVKHGKYHYLMYSAHGDCSEFAGIGVTRSLNIMGPYEKHGDPILGPRSLYKAPNHNSVVKDLDGQGDILVYHAYKKDQVCQDYSRFMMVSSIGWNEDDWPYIFDLEA